MNSEDSYKTINKTPFNTLQKNIIITGGSRLARSDLLWSIISELKDNYNRVAIGDSVILSRRHFEDPYTLVVMTCSHMRNLKKKLSLEGIPYSLYTFIDTNEHSKINPSLPCEIFTSSEFV